MNPEIDDLRKTFTYDPDTGDLWRMVDLRSPNIPPALITPQAPGRAIQVMYKTHWMLAHHICWALHHGRWPHEGMVIDHINGYPMDNCLANLRECTQQQNLCNQRRPVNNSSGYKGVSWHIQQRKWQAIYCGQGGKHLGYFDCPKKAHEAYCAFTKPLTGEFFNAG